MEKKYHKVIAPILQTHEGKERHPQEKKVFNFLKITLRESKIKLSCNQRE